MELISEGLTLITTLNQGVLGGYILPLDICHAIAIALEMRLSNCAPDASWIQKLMCYIIISAGGTMLSAFLMGEPIPWLCCNVTIPTYIIVWTLINYFPGNLISKLFCRQPFFLIIRVLDSMSWGHAVTTWGVDKVAMSPYSYSYVFRIAVGLVSGSGGGFLNETFNLRQTNWSFNTPKHYMGPSFGVLVTLATSIFYSFAVDHTDEICEHYFCLTPEPLKLLVIAILTPIYFSPFLEVKQVLRRHSKRRAKRKARASQERESQERNSVDQN